MCFAGRVAIIQNDEYKRSCPTPQKQEMTGWRLVVSPLAHSNIVLVRCQPLSYPHCNRCSPHLLTQVNAISASKWWEEIKQADRLAF